MLAEAEDGLIALIKTAALGQKLTTVASLPEIDGANLVGRFGAEAPAVYVAPSGFVVADGEARPRYGFACVARNPRGQDAARKGDGKAIGLYQIVEGVAALADSGTAGELRWRVTGVDFVPDEALFKAGLYVAVVRVEAAGAVPLLPLLDPALLDDFETFRASYDIAPHASAAEHAKWAGDPPDHTTTAPEVSETVTVQS